MLQRHSSRRARLDHSVLNERLRGAVAYDRIAGYFRSSLFEVAGEALMAVAGQVRIVCNAEVCARDVATAKTAVLALRQGWCAGKPEQAHLDAMPRYKALFEALTSGKVSVRVLPNDVFGLIHGKAGVIRRGDGTATAFLGSVNESATAWRINYELLWEDDNPETVGWVAEEFNALWHHAAAIDLAQCPFIVDDLKRIIARTVIEPEAWKEVTDIDQAVAAAAVETPVYRQYDGLGPHQKYFARLALERHRLGGARLVLADQVGLGKTVQLAMAAMLMALEDTTGGPILVLAPKALLEQWQEELKKLLNMPSARWTSKGWVDENEIVHVSHGARSLTECPRRLGLVSQGLVVRGAGDTVKQLLGQTYTCVIVDEAHRARRRSLPKVDAPASEVDTESEPNRLMAFLLLIATKTKSMLLATATPVQLHPVEAWDLLRILSQGNDSVLGRAATRSSQWFMPSRCLAVATGTEQIPQDINDGWEFVRDPLPAASEATVFAQIRRALAAPDKQWQFSPEMLQKISLAIQNTRLKPLLADFAAQYNPLLRCIVRRTRGYLESTINPLTNEYFLSKVEVRLFGEKDTDALLLSGYLGDAYKEAEKFSALLAQRVKSAGFFKTLLLRRLGSSMEAGRSTLRKLLGITADTLLEDDADDDDVEADENTSTPLSPEMFKNFTSDERQSLVRCLKLLEQGGSNDPKLEAVIGYLVRGTDTVPWLNRGCILFSQYYDTAFWVGERLTQRADFQGVDIGLYAGSGRSGMWHGGKFERMDRQKLKKRVEDGELTLILGTDAASEGLNLQRLGTLINIDLPWNPTRLEQRKGRIQRIGQKRDTVYVANLRYRDSVEDRVHQLLGDRLQAIHHIFGQIPDTLEGAWVKVALGEELEARKMIETAETVKHPFDAKYSVVHDAKWEDCPVVINPVGMQELLSKGW